MLTILCTLLLAPMLRHGGPNANASRRPSRAGAARPRALLARRDRRPRRLEHAARAGRLPARARASRPAAATWRALRRRALVEYTITAEDVAGPFAGDARRHDGEGRARALGYASRSRRSARSSTRARPCCRSSNPRRRSRPARRSSCRNVRRAAAREGGDRRRRRHSDRVAARRGRRGARTLPGDRPAASTIRCRSAKWKVNGVSRRSGVPLQPRPVLGRRRRPREGEDRRPVPTTRSAWSGSTCRRSTTASTARRSRRRSARRSRTAASGSRTGTRTSWRALVSPGVPVVIRK